MVSTSLLKWDGKCQKCRKLMSRCICFQEEADADVDQLHTCSSFQVTADATKSRPLWNALRKMHRKSVARSTLMQPSAESNVKDQIYKRSEVLPPLSAHPRPLRSTSRHQLHRLHESRPVRHESSKELGSEPLPERVANCRKDGLQYATIPASSYGPKRDVKNAGGLHTVYSTSSMNKYDGVNDVHRVKEELRYGPEEGFDYENDETVWEL